MNAIYSVSTTKILHFNNNTPPEIEAYLNTPDAAGQAVCYDCPIEATNVVNGDPITQLPPEPTEAEIVQKRLAEVRTFRNLLIKQCDWTQLPTARLTAEKLAEWNIYRDLLFDLPTVCDPSNVVYPTPPE
jgi:hypothetical protein